MDSADILLSNVKTAKRCGVTTRAIYSWIRLPELGFPRPCFINGRRYFSQAEIDRWRESRFDAIPPEYQFLKSPAHAAGRGEAA